MIKLCQYPAIDSKGNQLIEIFHSPDQLHHSHMDKLAAPFLPEVREYLDGLRPDPNSIYALINALGAFEFWSSNINGDAFEEEFLIHKGPVYGHETFRYYAKPFMHHANKGPNARAFGSVEMACWHPQMKRVELVARLDRSEAVKVGAQRVIDKVDAGELPETSMGCKVPYDLCSITTDWAEYKKALTTFDPKKHRHPGVAVLIYHKTVKPIRGLSITRDDYSDFAKYRMNEILPDGRKVCVFNPFPRFFDISFVFIGAEKTSKMMAKLASQAHIVVPSSFVAEQYGYPANLSLEQPATHKDFEKAASIESARNLLREFKKNASHQKRAEITKEIVPSQFGGKAVPILEKSEPTLPRDILDQMSQRPLSEALSTPTMMGITLKPREFQRITICSMGKRDLADRLDDANQVFRPVDEVSPSAPIGPEFISRLIASLLRGSAEERSVFGPVLRRRMIRITISGLPKQETEPEEVEDDLLDKISAAYNGYREQVIEKIGSLCNQLPYYPDVQADIYGVAIEDAFFEGMPKEAAGIDPKLLGAIPATYLLSALARRKMRNDAISGKETGILTDLLASHPHLAASAVGMAVLKAGGSDLPDKVIKGAISLGKRVAGLG